MSLKPLTTLNDHEYFAEITQKITGTKAGDRVALMTMSFSPTEPLTEPLMHELNLAAKRGVEVQLNVDAHSFMLDDAHTLPTGPILKYLDPSKSRRADYRAKFAALRELRLQGGDYRITNMPKRRLTNPFAGRSHIKLTVINNVVYVGGCNLSDTRQIDLMAKLDDAKTADWVHDFILRAGNTGDTTTALDNKDMTLRIDEATMLLIDVGRKRQSSIYEQALKLIDDATDWILLTCQFFPGGATAKHLAAALKRGVNVEVAFPHQGNHDALSIPHKIVELGNRYSYPRELLANRLTKKSMRLHAKLLATEQGALVGSHNYVTQGVNFGTAESTLLRLDPDFAKQAVEVFKARVAEAKKAL